MLPLNSYKTIFAAIGLIGIIACCVPSVMLFTRLPGGERFSELYALGSRHMASDYPYNVYANVTYLVYLGVGNHMGNSAYYEVCVKFRNSTEPLPNATSGESSPLPILYRYRVFLAGGDVWEAPLNFSFSNAAFDGGMCSVGRLDINDFVFDVNKVTSRDNETNGFYYQLFVELWRYNTTNNSFSFDNRFITLWLNVTQSF